MARPKKMWTIEVLEQFALEYATTPNHLLAKRYNVSISFIRRKAKELNLFKDALYKCRSQTWFLVQELYFDFSYSEIAKRAGVSKKTVERIAKRLNLQRLREEKNKMIALGTSRGLRSDIRRRLFGLETYYNRPIVSDKSRTEVANELRKYGYIVIKGSMTAYYNDTMERYEDIEENAIANGFRMLLWE